MSARTLALGPLLAAIALALPSAAAAQLLSRPVTCPDCIIDWYYVDHGFQTDYTCGNSTYGDHTGTDYSLRNGNFAIDQDNEVVAMASGTVVHTEDGYYDRCTQCGGFDCGTGYGNGFANQVIVNHGPYRVIYGHMKSGSIAVKEGDTVNCGQVLGFIGSSGCSTGAHVHVEPSLAADFQVKPYAFIDPYVGDCSETMSSLWLDQGPYRGLPGSACDDGVPTPVCPADAYPIWTCGADMKSRRRCVDGEDTTEPCPYGCSVMPVGTDDVCVLPPDADGDGVRADTDCDDADAARHPGAVEVCGDGVDQACSGSDMTCPPPLVPDPTTMTMAGGGGALVPPIAGAPATTTAPEVPVAASGTAGAGGGLPIVQAGAPALASQPPPAWSTPEPRARAAGCSAARARDGAHGAGGLAGLSLVLALSRLSIRKRAGRQRAWTMPITTSSRSRSRSRS